MPEMSKMIQIGMLSRQEALNILEIDFNTNLINQFGQRTIIKKLGEILT